MVATAMLLSVMTLSAAAATVLPDAASPIILAYSGTSVTIQPRLDDTLLINPGKGWVEYYGPSIYTSDFISVEYTRTAWADLEPAEGKYNWGGFDSMIKNFAANYGKKCAIGAISTYAGQAYSTPKWVFDAGAVPVNIPAGYLPEGHWVVPKTWDDPVYIAKMKNFITAFGEHFNGNPNLAFVDIRSYGDCGEGNGSIPGYTVNTTQANLSDNCYAPYVKAFPNTQLIVPWTGAWFDGKPADAIYVWLVSKGAGMRRDGICSTWSKDGSECLIAYPHAPAVMEYALTWPDTVAAGMDKNTGLRYDSPEELLLYVLNGKASYMQWHPEFYEQNKEFCRMLGNKLGYHFILKQADIPNRIQPGVSYPFKLTWLNDGVALLYEPCSFAVALLDANNNVVEKQWIAESNPRSWMPEVVTTEAFTVVFPSVPTEYKLAIGLFVNKRDPNPTYRLGIQGRVNNGWYVLSGTPNVVAAKWKNAAGGSWQNATNWTGNNTHNGIDVIADFSAIDLTTNATLTFDGEASAGSLIFGDASSCGNWVLNTGTGGGLTLQVSPSAPAPGIAVNKRTLVLNANLTSNQGLVKSGSGTLVLAGVNSLLGNTVINGGVLEIAGNSKLYTKWQVATVKVNTGATLRVNSWGGYNESGGLGQTPADYPNALLLDGGTLEFTGAPGVRGNSDRAFALGAGGGSLKNSSSGNWTLSASGTNTQAMVMNNSSLTLAGTGLCGQFQKRIAGNGSLTKTDGGTWILSAKNNYTGPTVVSGGKLVLLGDNNRSTSVTVAAGAELDITGKLYATGNIINNGTIVLSGAEQFGAGGRITNNGTIINNSPSLTLPAIVNHGTISSGKTKSDGLEAIRPLSSP